MGTRGYVANEQRGEEGVRNGHGRAEDACLAGELLYFHVNAAKQTFERANVKTSRDKNPEQNHHGRDQMGPLTRDLPAYPEEIRRPS